MNTILKTIEKIKVQTGEILAKTLDSVGTNDFSEKKLSDSWLQAIRQTSDFYPDGWYVPPPHGIITVFGKAEDHFKRICQPSFRPEYMWPSDSAIFNEQDIIALYASPVHEETNLIGDFGLNLYRGKNAEIKEHFERVFLATLHIANSAQTGMPFHDLYNLAMTYGSSQGFENNIDSYTDNTGTNIGHTIPLSYASDTSIALIKEKKRFEDIKEILRTGRKFINSAETQRIEDNMAFTIEPRFSTSSMPNTWFHTTVIFENGERRICHGFKPVLQKFGMDYLLKFLP